MSKPFDPKAFIEFNKCKAMEFTGDTYVMSLSDVEIMLQRMIPNTTENIGAGIKWEPVYVDPEAVRKALQQCQFRAAEGSETTPVRRELVSAARYAIEKLQQTIRTGAEAISMWVQWSEQVDKSIFISDERRKKCEAENSELKSRLDESMARIADILKGDDGQAWDEAEKFLRKMGKPES